MRDIVETIVRAALDPDGWDRVAAEMEALFQSQTSGIHIQNVRDNFSVYANLTGHTEKDVQFYIDHISDQNPWFEHEGTMRQGRTVTDQTIDQLNGSSTAFENTAFFAEWERACDYRHHMGGTILENDQLTVNYTNGRSARIGHYTAEEIRQFQSMMPYLSIAAETAVRLDSIKMELHASSSLVDRLSCGIVLIGPTIKVLYANKIAEGLLKAGVGIRYDHGKFHASAPALMGKIEATAKVRNRILTRDATQSKFAPFSGSVRGTGDKPLTITVLPIPHDVAVFSWNAPVAIIVISGQDGGQSIAPPHWQERYGFTDLETSVAQKVVEGLSAREISESLELTYQTAGWYIKQLRAKTESRHHAELQRKLSLDIINFIRR